MAMASSLEAMLQRLIETRVLFVGGGQISQPMMVDVYQFDNIQPHLFKTAVSSVI